MSKEAAQRQPNESWSDYQARLDAQTKSSATIQPKVAEESWSDYRARLDAQTKSSAAIQPNSSVERRVTPQDRGEDPKIPNISITTPGPGIDREKDTPQLSKLESVIKHIKSASRCSFEVEKVKTIDGDSMQAMAADGKIIITEDMVVHLSEHELAWVIGHEVAHLEHDDAARRAAVTREIRAKTHEGLAKLDSDLKKSGHGLFARVSGQVVAGVVAGAAGCVGESFESRKREDEADRRATEIIQSAGFKPEAGISALRKIHGGRLGHHTFFRGLVASHPSSATRAEDIERQSGKKEKRR